MPPTPNPAASRSPTLFLLSLALAAGAMFAAWNLFDGIFARKRARGPESEPEPKPEATPAIGADLEHRKVWTRLHNLENSVRRVEGELEPYAIPEFAWPPEPAASALAQAVRVAPETARGVASAAIEKGIAGRRAAAGAVLGSVAADATALDTQAAALRQQADTLAGRAEVLCQRILRARAAVRRCPGDFPDAPAVGDPLPPAEDVPAGLRGAGERLAWALQAAEEEMESLAGEVEGLQQALTAAGEEMRRQLDLLGEAAHAITIRGARPTCEGLQRMVSAMDAAWTALPVDAQAEEAVRHYHAVLSDRLAEFRRRLAHVERELSGGEVSLGPVEIPARIEALEARCARLRASSYAAGQAAPVVQQSLRPILDDLIREFLAPLLEEAYGTEEDHPLRFAAAETRRVLRETIDFEVIFPQAGEPINEQVQEETEVRPAASAAERDTVAETVRPGYRWAGEVLAKARVISRR